MAAQAHALVNCSEQKTAETGDQEQEGSGSLKNGTSLEDSDELSGNVGVKNRSPSSSSSNQPREMTMENFQDGGTHQPNSRPASASADQGSFPSLIDRQRLNPDFQGFNQVKMENVSAATNEDFRNPQETFNHATVSESSFGSRSGYIGDQHGGQGISGNVSDMATNSQSNKLYGQYNQQQMRPGFIHSPRNMTLGPQQRPVTAPVMGSYAGSNTPQQQRFLSGPSISQQGGPTPTLNQLLQAPNPLQRYHNSYEYNPSSGLHKGVGDQASSSVTQYPGSNTTWTNMRGSAGYCQSMGSTMHRSQSGAMPESSIKRPYMAPGGQTSTPPAQGQYSQQYRYAQPQPQGTSGRNLSQSYPQQGGQQYNIQQASNSQVAAAVYDQRPTSQISGYGQSQVQAQAQNQEIGGTIDELPTETASSGGSTTPGLRTPSTPPISQGQSIPQHSVVSPHRPAPSPSGSSAGSPSMSPALGQQQNIPMPPRPSSSQSETSGQSQMSQTPMAAQGYSQQMAPPQMYSNKLHQGMMSGAGSHMTPYSSQTTGHYPQSNYHRPPNTMSMQTYGAQNQTSYPSPGPPNYPTHSTVVRMSSHPSNASQNFTGPSSGNYMNSQYSGSTPPSTGYGMNNMMPPPNQYPKGSMPPPGGAQAAAQAAVMAAASSANLRSSPMYLRQHLQQKMYSNSYNAVHPQAAPGSLSGAPGSGNVGSTSGGASAISSGQEAAPMPPPTTTSQAVNMSQTSPIPSGISTPASMGSSSGCDGPSLPISGTPVGFTQTSAPSIGTPPTTVTQSISSPLPSTAVTVSSPSVLGISEHSQSQTPQSQLQQTRSSNSGPQAPLAPPPVMDEGSQASNASASSSLPEERVETPKPNKLTISHPPTPNTIPSPGAASMSSFHDEFDSVSVSSPSWPRTPASPVVNNQGYDHHPIKRPDGLLKLYDMSDEPERRNFLDKLIFYNEERGTPISQCPTISKQPLDLYRLYIAVKERGGFVDVTKGKHWKDVAGAIGIGASSSAAYTLRKQYIKHLLPYECKFDRGGIDPQPIISQVEASSRKKTAKNSQANQEPYPPPSANQMMDGYPSSYPSPYPPGSGPHGGMMPNADYPSTGAGHHPSYPGQMANHTGGEGTMDPFSDEMPTSQYQRHNSADSYGYSQGSMNAVMPPYSGTQSSMTAGSFGYSGTNVPQQDQYSDQYPPNIVPTSDNSYGNRSMVQDPYGPPPGGYPPNRTVGQHSTAQYPPYQAPCDQDRYDQQQPQQPPPPQGPLMRPSSQSNAVMGPVQGDPSGYPPHRYPGQQVVPRENMASTQVTNFQGRPAMTPTQYSGPNSQSTGQPPYSQVQQDSYRGPDSSHNYQPQMSRLQSTLIQRLLPKSSTSVQNYPPNQQTMYSQAVPPPNKVAPTGNIPQGMYQREVYSMGAKRHPDYSKPHMTSQDQYHMGSYGQQQTSGPYGDRNQYHYRPSHMMPTSNPGPPTQGWPRDNRQYASPTTQNQYPPNQRDGWDGSRHMEGSAMGSTNWPMSRYSGSQPEPYSSQMQGVGPSMGPKMPLGRSYMSPNKGSPHSGVGPPPQYTPPPPRKEIIFPPDSVEAVTPVLVKRRRMASKDVSPMEAWRIMMSLKSGLLAESTWALDVLSVLMYDDSTVLYFGLGQLPGLLEVLMDHYRRCLNLIFSLAEDLEVGHKINDQVKSEEENFRKGKRKWFEIESDFVQDEIFLGLNECDSHIKDPKTVLLDTENYTRRTRFNKIVRTHQEDTLFTIDPDKKWDSVEGFNSGSEHWQSGGGDITSYIQANFQNMNTYVRFVRIMEDVNKDKKTCGDCEKNIPHINCMKTRIASDSFGCREEDAKELIKDEDDRERKEEEEDTENEEEENLCPDTSEKPEENSTKDNLESVKKESNPESTEEKDSQENSTSEDSDNKKDNVEEKDLYPKLRPSSSPDTRVHLEDLEEEAYNRDEPSLYITSEAQESLARRCMCISTLLRNLSFVPGNDAEMSKHASFLLIMGRLLVLHHVHSPRKPPQRHYDREDEGESTSQAESTCSSLSAEQEWWWDVLHTLRENTLVTLANVTGQLDLSPYPEAISLPLFDGLLHWAVCPSSYAQDPLPTQPPNSVLSPQRLALEALSKLSILETNVDLMLATPQWSRIKRFFSLLTKWLGRNEDQVLREFAVVLLSNLSQADSGVARAIALQCTCIPQLITFVEQAEQSALQVANSQGINALRENPELMGTTLDMVRRAAGTLRCLARVPENRSLFLQHQQRLLALVMSQILDQGVASIVADVLFECSQEEGDSFSGTNTTVVSSPLPTTAAT